MSAALVTALAGAPLASITDTLKTFVADHGVLAVFLLMTLESCGIPIPSEVTMPVAGALAAGALGGGGDLSPVSATLAGTVGNLAGSLLAYVIAAALGERFLLGPGRYVGINRSHVELADRLFRRYGLLLVFVGRLLPVVRTYISFPAGLARVEIVRFGALTFLGALPWCAALVAAGYELGTRYDDVAHPIQVASYVIAVAVVVGLVWWIVRGRRARAARR
ncbi:MAG TPA: DedA family protein [Candidatus Dormibacteraeota bacterium]|nr:DedA family protein [Candidatus Dormibacteraeota bacterium]